MGWPIRPFAMADSGKELNEIDGKLAGSLLGAFTYLGGRMVPEEFVKWIEAADSQAILAGANAGAAYANRQDIEGSAIQGAITGGGLGLLGGFAGLHFDPSNETQIETPDEIAAYLEELGETGVKMEE